MQKKGLGMRQTRYTDFAFGVLALLLFAPPALANVGTPLMWMGFMRLVLINLVIGVGEGLLIAWVFRTGWLRTSAIMLLANYFSWYIGEILLLPIAAEYGEGILGPQPLYHVLALVRYVIAVAFVLSVLLEWPFCFWCFRKKSARIARSTVCAVAVNLLSYAALVWLYAQASGVTVLTKLTMEPSLEFAASHNAWVYYISRNDYALCRVRSNGKEHQQVLSPSEMRDKGFCEPRHFYYKSKMPFVCLYAKPADEGGRLDLWCDVNDEQIALLTGFLSPSAKVRVVKDAEDPPWYGPDEAVELVRSEWKVETGSWALEGLWATRWETEKRFALELPFLNWYSRFPTILPGNQVIYQLGDQIVLLDLNADKIGVITRGYSPLVVLETEDAKGETLAAAEVP